MGRLSHVGWFSFMSRRVHLLGLPSIAHRFLEKLARCMCFSVASECRSSSLGHVHLGLHFLAFMWNFMQQVHLGGRDNS
jgi:hypothetical protein